jgi:hypothetical protein
MDFPDTKVGVYQGLEHISAGPGAGKWLNSRGSGLSPTS